jgi:sec-independent protein translocase protein TatB
MNIFGVGAPELLFLLILGLLVIGPERLPAIARSIGHMVARVMAWQHTSPEAQMFRSIRHDFEREIQDVRDELLRTKEQFALNAQALQQEGKSVESYLSQLAVDPTRHASEQTQQQAVPTSRPSLAKKSGETPTTQDAEQDNHQNGTNEPAEAADIPATEAAELSAQSPTLTEKTVAEANPASSQELEQLKLQMQAVVRELLALQEQLHASGFLDADWKPRQQLEALLIDMHALQQQLKSQGYLATDWTPPSHTMQHVPAQRNGQVRNAEENEAHELLTQLLFSPDHEQEQQQNITHHE